MKDQLKTTKYTVSVGFEVHEPKIQAAKKYLKDEFNNKYDADPHFNFIITALPDYRQSDLEKVFDEYFRDKQPLLLKLGRLHYDIKTKFFSIPIIGDEVISIHKELLSTLNTIRDGYVREKDLVRIEEGRTSEKETEYIKKYGYLRVLDNFIPHITIGNINVSSDINIEEIEINLNNILNNFYNKQYTVNTIIASFIEDAEVQSDYKMVWEKEYSLE